MNNSPVIPRIPEPVPCRIKHAMLHVAAPREELDGRWSQGATGPTASDQQPPLGEPVWVSTDVALEGEA